MTIEMFNKILSNSGKFRHISWRRDCKVYKTVSDHIEKETSGTSLRAGCEYDNLGAVVEGRANGTLPSENQGLKGYTWVQYPYLLKRDRDGKMYLRLSCAKNTTFHSHYYENGIEVNKNDIMDKLMSNEKSSHNSPLTVFNIALDSIVSFD